MRHARDLLVSLFSLFGYARDVGWYVGVPFLCLGGGGRAKAASLPRCLCPPLPSTGPFNRVIPDREAKCPPLCAFLRSSPLSSLVSPHPRARLLPPPSPPSPSDPRPFRERPGGHSAHATARNRPAYLDRSERRGNARTTHPQGGGQRGERIHGQRELGRKEAIERATRRKQWR